MAEEEMTHTTRIGLENLGVPYKGSFLPEDEVRFVTPDFGPPRVDFWLNPEDEGARITDSFFVTRIDSPSKFWMQNVTGVTQLDELEGEMTRWYNEYWALNEKLDDYFFVIGGFYAAYIEEFQKWYRVRLNEYVHGGDEREYMVQLIDWGATRVVQSDCIYYLREIYTQLPIQVAQAECYSEGQTNEFTLEDKVQFKDDVGGEEVKAIVLSVHTEPDNVFKILSVVLMRNSNSPTRTPEDFINRFYSMNGRIQLDQLKSEIIFGYENQP